MEIINLVHSDSEDITHHVNVHDETTRDTEVITDNVIVDDDTTSTASDEVTVVKETSCVHSHHVTVVHDTMTEHISGTKAGKLSFISVEMLRWEPKSRVYKVTKNITAKRIEVVQSPPLFYPCDPDGFATFVNLKSDEMKLVRQQYSVSEYTKLLHDTSYSMQFRNGRDSTILVTGAEYPAVRRTAKCSGVKCCSYSSKLARTNHHGKVPHSQPVPPGDAPSLTFVDDEFQLARQVFFYAQNFFPPVCKHHGTASRMARNAYVDNQRRPPNWVFRTGALKKTVNGTIQRPDFIGCAQFGQVGVRDRSGCDIRPLPSHLQGASSAYVNQLVLHAVNGTFPRDPLAGSSPCKPLRRSHLGKHCENHVHGFEAVPLVVLPCSAIYHFLVHYEEAEPSWMVVVGIGTHGHQPPVPRPSPVCVRKVISDMHSSNPLVTVKEIRKKVSSSFLRAAPMASLRKQHQNVRGGASPYNHTISGLLQNRSTILHYGGTPYITSVIDEREGDKCRPPSEQIGIVVLMCNENLVKRSVTTPHYGVDGTFNMVVRCSENVSYELVSIVSKDPVTGTTFSVVRMLSSRKTVACRKLLFDFFLRKLTAHGLEDPFVAEPSTRLTVTSDFETTFAIALGNSLCETFHPDVDIMVNWEAYVRLVCYGCAFHAKRIVHDKEKVGDWVMSWAVGTRLLSSKGEVEYCLDKMAGMGRKWKSFAAWLCQNTVAYILWFETYCKGSISRRSPVFRVLWTTNANEAMHSRLKGMPQYRLSNNRGLPLCDVVRMLETVDEEDYNNVSGERGLQYNSLPLWRRTHSRGSKRNADSQVVVNGVPVSASEPKRRRTKYQ